MIKRGLALLLLAASLVAGSAAAQQQRPTPYWASIASGRAMMRTGPSQNYPATWEYRRADLPIRVIEVYESWRKIQDPDGTTGWMSAVMLADRRTALVRGDGPRPLHESPDEGSPVRYRAEPGVVGRISHCASGWCRLDVHGRAGYIRSTDIWGVDPDEVLR
jgi:SH3-like domain-containing protein